MLEILSIYLATGALLLSYAEHMNTWDEIGIIQPHSRFFARILVVFFWLPLLVLVEIGVK